MASAPYKLSATLFGHSLDVRAIAVLPGNIIVSGSRDKTAKIWCPTGLGTSYCENITFKGHTNFVSSVCVLKTSSSFPNGLILTGGNDNCICGYTLESADPLFILKEHKDTVCNLSEGLSPDSFLSSSWDCTAKFWLISSSRKSAITFSGHKAAVWAVIELPNDTVVTGSADKDIIIWNKNGGKIKTLTGHTDCVRGLASLNSEFFLSVANDASVRKWTLSGDCVDTYYGHTNYIYSVCADASSGGIGFVTSGEDRTVRYWQNGENTQTISLPAQSVWTVACLDNGDIAVGTSDGVVRIFTQDPARVTNDEELAKFEEEVKALEVNSNEEIGGVKISDLPGREALYEPGKNDGQTKLIRDGTGVQCYNWSAAEGQWVKIGDVLGAAGGNSGKMFEGKEYDYIFSVDIEEGKPPLKLPFNKTDDPWVAAQAFIHKNSLPQMFLDQVANFIVQNSGGTVPAPVQSSDFVDPFTGVSRYVPSTGGSTKSTSGSNLDPFTGSSSYTTSPQQSASTSKSNGNSALPSSHSYIPQRTYLKFEQGNLTLIQEKLREFNSKQGDGGNNVDERDIDNVVNKLAKTGIVDASVQDSLWKLLQWPKDIVFPVLDILRLAIKHQAVNSALCTNENVISMMNLLQSFVNNDCTVPANQMLALRILCNMMSYKDGEKLVIENKAIFLTNIAGFTSKINKNVQIAATSLVLNYSVAFIKTSDINGIELLNSALINLFFTLTDNEALFRIFVAIGTLLFELEDSLKVVLINNLRSNNNFIKKLNETCDLVNVGNLNDPILYKMVSCATQVCLLLK